MKQLKKVVQLEIEKRYIITPDDMIKKELMALEANSPYPKNKFIKFNWLIPRLHKLSKKLKSNEKNN